MSVLDGPREEWRRIFHEGQPQWVKPEGDALLLGDGRRIAEAEVTYLPPCEPSKILCIHLNYDSRRLEFRAPPQETPTDTDAVRRVELGSDWRAKKEER